MKLSFTKYHGAGNDFILIDFRNASPLLDPALLARRLCARRLGIGADGLILLCPSEAADFKMRIFNADGSEPSMCGNGIRCLYDFVQKREIIPSELKIETLHGILTCRRNGEEIVVNLGAPEIIHWPIHLDQGQLFVLDTGVPHAVLFVDELDKVDVAEVGKKIRFHSQFAPQGVNVNFATIDPKGALSIRTYERGVEAETLACGTGAAAAAFVAMKHRGLPSPVFIQTRLCFEKDPIEYRKDLSFQFCEDGEGKMQIEMLGKAQEIFEGLIDYH